MLTKMISPKVSVLEVKRKYKSILINYLTQHQLRYKVLDNGSNGRVRFEVQNLGSEDAFAIGAKTQAQLLDGEYLI